MNVPTLASFVLGAACAVVAWPGAQPPSPPQAQDAAAEMRKMMDAAKKFTAPGPMHQKLADYVGSWDVEIAIGLAGSGQPPMKSKAKATFSWLLPNRFLKQEVQGQMMGREYQGFGLTGYDNFKQAFVSTWVDTLNTYKLDWQGKLAQDGRTLVFYGPLDEYLTGENDKMVKYVYRWKDDDHFAFEIHDLGIGETNAQIVTMNYSRVK